MVHRRIFHSRKLSADKRSRRHNMPLLCLSTHTHTHTTYSDAVAGATRFFPFLSIYVRGSTAVTCRGRKAKDCTMGHGRRACRMRHTHALTGKTRARTPGIAVNERGCAHCAGGLKRETAWRAAGRRPRTSRRAASHRLSPPHAARLLPAFSCACLCLSIALPASMTPSV